MRFRGFLGKNGHVHRRFQLNHSWTLGFACSMLGKLPKRFSQMMGFTVIYHGTIHKKSPEKHIQGQFSWLQSGPGPPTGNSPVADGPLGHRWPLRRFPAGGAGTSGCATENSQKLDLEEVIVFFRKKHGFLMMFWWFLYFCSWTKRTWRFLLVWKCCEIFCGGIEGLSLDSLLKMSNSWPGLQSKLVWNARIFTVFVNPLKPRKIIE